MTTITDIPENALKNILQMSHPCLNDDGCDDMYLFNRMKIKAKIYFLEKVLDEINMNSIKSYDDIKKIKKSVYLYYEIVINCNDYPIEHIIYILNSKINEKKLLRFTYINDNMLFTRRCTINKHVLNKVVYNKNSTMSIIDDHISNNSVGPFTIIKYARMSNSIHYNIIRESFFDIISAKTYLSITYIHIDSMSCIRELMYRIMRDDILVSYNKRKQEYRHYLYFNKNWYVINYQSYVKYNIETIINKTLKNILHIFHINETFDDVENEEYYGASYLLPMCYRWSPRLTSYLIHDNYTKYIKPINHYEMDSKELHDNYIHFLNGSYNIRTNKFNVRNKITYITQFLNYEYIDPSQFNKKDYDLIKNIIKESFNGDEEQYKISINFMRDMLIEYNMDIKTILTADIESPNNFLIYDTDFILFNECFMPTYFHSDINEKYNNIISRKGILKIIKIQEINKFISNHKTKVIQYYNKVSINKYNKIKEFIQENTFYKNVFFQLLINS